MTTDHPTPADLAAHLYADLPPDHAQSITAHLAQCPACRDALDQLHAARTALQSWQLPDRPAAPAPRTLRPALRIAAAIALLLTGFAIARLSAPRPLSEADIHLQITAALTQQALQQTTQQQAFESTLTNTLTALAARTTADSASLRRDLDTVALRTQAAFQQISYTPSNP